MARPTLTHWGAYLVESDGMHLTAVHPFPTDPDPSPLGRSMLEHDHPLRVRRPAIRSSWLESGPGAATDRRGVDPFVEVEWDAALDLAAEEIDRVRREHGNRAIFSGSYGWASAGRFHHAQSQLRRFMSLIGGSTTKVNTYSLAAAEVIVPHVLGYSFDEIQDAHTSWQVIARSTELFVAFGGVAWKNSQVQAGGQGRHRLRDHIQTCLDNGLRFVNIGPFEDDLPGAEWWPIRPNTDTALMLALIYTLIRNDMADEEFLAAYTTGWDRLAAYIVGDEDGVPKDPAWAGDICELEPSRIEALAGEMATYRTMVNASWALQRADHGEQPFWAIIALACALGQIGLPGGGFGLGYGAVGSVGNGVSRLPLPSLPRSPDPIDEYIPVARIADMLLDPDGSYVYDGRTRRYPHVRLVYWAGGNPFHHHQDLARLVEAWRRPDTVIVNEPWWTATARRADIVFPVSLPLERDDLGGAPADDHLIAMHSVVDPVGEARSDHAVFAGLAERLGVGEDFTAGRSEAEWLKHLYERFREVDATAPSFEEFWEKGFHSRPSIPADELILLDGFRFDPHAHPLPTPSGRIELYSDAIAAARPRGCPPHPAWIEPAEWLGAADPEDLHLVSNQPRTRLHSQWNHAGESADSKLAGREPARLHPEDAARRRIVDGDVIRIHNERGSTLAGAVLDPRVRSGVVQLSTGAWYDPADPSDPHSLDRAGNPNVLTRDRGTSELAQGPTAQTCLVRVERWSPGRSHEPGWQAPPEFDSRR